MNFIIKNKLTIAGILLGAIGGYLNYHFAGETCTNGNCSISSSSFNSSLFGALMGGLLFNFFQKEKIKS